MASLISFAITCSGFASQPLRDLRHSLVASRSLYLISLRVLAMPTEFDPRPRLRVGIHSRIHESEAGSSELVNWVLGTGNWGSAFIAMLCAILYFYSSRYYSFLLQFLISFRIYLLFYFCNHIFYFFHGSFCQGLELMPAELTEDSSNTPNLVIIGISLAAFGFLLVNASLVAWFFVHQRRKKGYYYLLLFIFIMTIMWAVYTRF